MHWRPYEPLVVASCPDTFEQECWILDYTPQE